MAGSSGAFTALPAGLRRSRTMAGVALVVGHARRKGPFSEERFGILTRLRLRRLARSLPSSEPVLQAVDPPPLPGLSADRRHHPNG
jgi:hypothetical protein